MSNDKSILQHIDDLVNGIFDSTVMTALEFGHFIIKIIGIENIILDDDTKQDEAIEQAEVFYKAVKLIISNDEVRKQIFQFLKQDFQEQPLYYIGGIVGPGAMVSLIKKPTQKIIYFGVNKTQQAFNLSNNTLYPYYKNIQNSFNPLCSIDNKNSNLLKEFNFDSFSCSFYSNSIFNQSLKYLYNIQVKKDYIDEYKIFLEKLNYFSQEYNYHKLVSIQVINNPKIAYIQKLSLHDIDNIHINSEPYLLKALYFCEDYVLFNKNQQASFDENIVKELEFNSSFYIIFLLHKSKLNDTYLNARKELYKSINEFKKLGFKDLEYAYQTYMNFLIINEYTNKKDKTTSENQESSINNTKEQDFNLLSSHSKNLNHFILENKNKRIIFLDNASSMSNLIHIYDKHCDIFLKNESLLNIVRIEKEYNIKFKEFNTRVFFYEKLLLGANENNPFLFENKEENLLYYFKYDKENLKTLGDLHIKYHYYNAKIKNYSLLEKSLNITLKPKELKKEIAYNNTSFNKISKEPLNESSSSTKEPCFITLHLKDEQDKAINYAKLIIKGFKHNEALETIKLKRKSDAQGKIRFDKEKYFKTCYSFKIKLDEKEAYYPTPLQNAKRIFNTYINHKEGLVLKFRAKDHLVYDGFNVYHYQGNNLIKAYMARSGTAKASNEKRSNRQIASCFYQGKRAYFYYDDESIKDKFGTLAEGQYYFKINEITKDTSPHFLKDYPFEMGRTWGKYCVRLYSDKECLQTKKQTKDNLYLYSINDKGEFGSSGSIGMAQAQLLENLSQQAKWIHDEKDGIVSLSVKYPKKLNHKIVFANNTIDLNTSFAPGTYIRLQLEEKETSKELTWAYIHCESETKKESFLNGAYVIKTDELEILNYNTIDKTLTFHLPISRANEPIEETKDYKYYIIVFAYDKKKSVPNEEDAYIIIDMSFRVGVGSDEGVRESGLRNNLYGNHKNIIQTNCIFSVFEAIKFLETCQKIKEEINETNNLNFFTNYPQLAGKIAYIYYRFDLSDKEFIKSVSDGNEYLKEREEFYKIASDVYIKNPIYKIAFEKRLQNKLVDINIVKDFLKDFAKRLGIDERNLPVIGYVPKEGDSGTYNYLVNTLDLNPNASYINFIDTIIHEFRHFYIYRIKNNSQNSIEKLLYINTIEFYTMWNFHILLDCYDKKCLIYDSVEYGTLKCYLNQTYYESRKTEKKEAEGKVDCPLYFIQPAERDAKIIAGKFREKIGVTNA